MTDSLHNPEAVLAPKILDSLPGRADYVRARLVAISRTAAEMVMEVSILLREVKENAYWAEYGFPSFDAFILDLREQGQLEFGPRQARHLLQVADMFTQNGITAEQVGDLGISKLKEIASIPMADEQRKLLEAAKGMTTFEVQQAAKVARDKAYGRESDPLAPWTFMTTDSQRTFLKDCLALGRKLYAIEDTVSDVTVLVDYMLAEWHGYAIEQEKLAELQRARDERDAKEFFAAVESSAITESKPSDSESFDAATA